MAKLKPAVSEADQQTGNVHASITLVEYGDYQCPYCGRAYPLLKKLLKEKGGDFRFVFRNFPLQEIHPVAMAAALAAEAAAKQGKFWEMHDAIYERQDDLSTAMLLDLAKSLKLDPKQFAQDWKSNETVAKVESDFESGVRSGVNGTPAFFVNGEKLNSYDESYESLLDAIGVKTA